MDAPARGWSIYWTIWFWLMLGSFLGPEIFALATRWQNTLSAWVWSLEKFAPGQSVTKWTAFHFLLIGVLLILFLWLLGHFGWGLWRD